MNSFVPGTMVLLAGGGKKAIEDIKVGDLVAATDPESGQTHAEPVIATVTGSGVKDLVTITVTAKDASQPGVLVATAGHPFWVADRAEWVDAGDLQPGDWLQTSSGTWVQVTAIEHDHREQTVHNLTIATTHTYYAYAGNTALLTHNCGGGSSRSASAGMADGASTVWPPNNGFAGAPRVTVLKPGTQIDRFGWDGGRFVAPNGSSIAGRSLAPGTTEKPYKVFEVTNRLVVQEGSAAPWFGQPGGGVQYYLPASVEDLLNTGYIRRIG